MDESALVKLEFDPNFEPQTRVRSNTWPCRPVEDFVDGHGGSPSSDEPGLDHSKDNLGIKQKTSSRRNAWGNLSYADLITKAIQSSPDQRLTLSQIYDWMVQNVPYFKDKGDNTSSAGWKNSIRHNLSLHSRFMRIQNEGTGKSSWWVLNPDAKPGKAPRRRAGSMETKNLEKKRGRIKKRIECIRAGQENGTLPNHDDLDFHYTLNLSPEFRTRAGSNASSCGRLSPIQAAVEPDLHDGQVPPMSPIPWSTELEDNYNTNSNEGFSLVDSFVGGLSIKEEPHEQNLDCDQNDVEMSTLKLMSGGSMVQNNYDDGYPGPPSYSDAPPSYSDHLQHQQQQQQSSPHSSVLNLDTMASQNRNYTTLTSKQMDMYPQDNMMVQQQKQQQRQNMMIGQNMSSPDNGSLCVNTQSLHSPGRSPQLSPSNYVSPRGGYNGTIHSPQAQKCSPQQSAMVNPPPPLNSQQQQQQSQMGGNGGTRSLLQQCLEAPNDSMLRAALTQSQVNATYQQPQQQYLPSMYNNGGVYVNISVGNNSMGPPPPPGARAAMNNNLPMNPSPLTAPPLQHPSPLALGCGPQVMNQMVGPGMGPMPQRNISNPSLSEIDTDSMLDLDYDVEQLLRQELAMDANLDFNFENNPPNQSVATSDNQNLVR